MDGPSVSLGSKLSNAKVSFAIFKRDIKRLLMNPVALVVTLGVCVIPSLYAWYNIVANWDPYGNTQGIKIAIANNDQGSELHNAAALNGLGNAVEGNDFFAEFLGLIAAVAAVVPSVIVICHFVSSSR